MPLVVEAFCQGLLIGLAIGVALASFLVLLYLQLRLRTPKKPRPFLPAEAVVGSPDPDFVPHSNMINRGGPAKVEWEEGPTFSRARTAISTLPTRVHLAGEVYDGHQRCVVCGFVLVEWARGPDNPNGLSPFRAGVSVVQVGAKPRIQLLNALGEGCDESEWPRCRPGEA